MFLVSRLLSLPILQCYPVRKAGAYAVPDRVYARTAFRRSFGRFPAQPPVTYNEHLNELLASGRLAQYPDYGDKLALRKIAAKRIGEQYLTPLLATADRLTRGIWEELPQSFFIKPSHGSHWYHRVQDKATADFGAIAAMTDHWLSRDYSYFYREQQYRGVKPMLMVEGVLDQGDDRAESDGVIDYKIYCFHGRPIFVHAVRGQPARERVLYDDTWTKLAVRFSRPNDGDYPRPDKLDEMFRVATAMSEGFDFARVDLYCIPEGVFFGEVTLTPMAGFDGFDPPEFDTFLGSLWKDRAAAHAATLERWHER